MMKSNLIPEMLVEFIDGDFASTWNALAAVENADMNRGNFMFARQAMLYLEVACRLCRSDQTGDALRAMAQALHRRDPRYFARLPAACYRADPSEFSLPSLDGPPRNLFLSALFDVIRNGQAHQYQQIPVHLTDGREWSVGLTGATFGAPLVDVSAEERLRSHLTWSESAAGDLLTRVRTDILFLDIRASVGESGLVGRGLSMDYLARPRPGSGNYAFTSDQLKAILKANFKVAG